MDLNLRQLLKKTGGKGLNLNAVRVYGFKLLKALLLLRKEGIVHADMKPDNILVNDSRTTVKLVRPPLQALSIFILKVTEL